MRKIVFLSLLLAACSRRHPVSPAPLTIAITRDGFVKLDGKALTLEELGTLLAVRREKAPLEEVGPEVKASTLPVLLEAEDDALGLHLRWVRTILAEQKIWRVSLPGGRDARLPIGGRVCPPSPPDRALLVRILVLDGGTYEVGDRTTRDVAEIGTWIDAASREGTLCPIGEIWEQPGVPWRLVRPAFDLLRSRGVKRIDFPTAIPTRDVRASSPLPRSGSWTRPKGWSGIHSVGYWPELDVYEGVLEEPEEPEPD